MHIYIYINTELLEGEQRSPGRNTSPTGFGACSSTCCQWDGEDVPAPWERSNSHITYAVEEFLLSIIPNSVIVWSLQKNILKLVNRIACILVWVARRTTHGPYTNAGWSILMLWSETTMKPLSLLCCLLSTITRAYISQDLVKARRHEISIQSSPIVLKFDRWLGTSAAKPPVNFQSGDWSIFPNCKNSVGNSWVAKSEYRRYKYRLPIPVMGHIWWPGDSLWPQTVMMMVVEMMTHWPLGDPDANLKFQFSILFSWYLHIS